MERRLPVAAPTVLQSVLVVDDEASQREVLSAFLEDEGFAVDSAASGREALEAIDRASYDVILSDVRMPELDGWQLLDELSRRDETPIVLMMSAFDDREIALETIQKGAYDYLTKPFRTDELLVSLRKAEEREKLRQENLRLRRVLREESERDIVGKSPKMVEIFELVDKVADYKSSVLLQGESGTGKELIARALHFRSSRRDNPFVAINCAAIPEQLLESELFGHVKGAFTDAIREKRGLFETANTGTLFLDEIGELPQALQVKLLRVLQENEIRPVGGEAVIPIDVRIVAATVRDLADEVRAERFREDLYYRLNVLAIRLPALRARREDLPELAEHLLAKHSERLGIPLRAISKASMRLLMDYDWPGNVRELENVLERALVMGDGEIHAKDLPQQILEPNLTILAESEFQSGNGLALKPCVRRLEEKLIRRALDVTGGNRTKAAKVLEISHRTLLYKMSDYGVR